jgi:NAD-dependent SIR2 family protein deacetylase
MDKEKLGVLKDLFKNSKNITFFTGAGVSVNSGIPDFRSEGGLYSFVKQKYDLPFAEAIFDIDYFKEKPEPFFDLSKDLINKDIQPTIAHKFIAWLEEHNKISLVMTQNIDMLHQKAGNKKVVECHGSYQTAHCLNCKKLYHLNEIENILLKGSVPYCSCGGVIKPDIVFFGEQLPESFFINFYNPPKTDLLVVFGSSLEVQPAASFALSLAGKHKSILVNLSKTSYDSYFDYVINEDIDKVCSAIWKELESIKD